MASWTRFSTKDTQWIIDNFQNNIPSPNANHSKEIQMEIKEKIQINNNVIKKTTNRIANLISQWENFNKILRVTGYKGRQPLAGSP